MKTFFAAPLILASVWGFGSARAGEPTATPQTVPAAGRQEAIAAVETFGRYAMFVQSEQGTSLQVVDRMAGPGPIAGSPGAINGRRDEFLERGEVKLVLRSHREGSGEAKVAIRSFKELNGGRSPRLVELKPISTTLSDFEQRSYWLDLRAAEIVSVEAAGRFLHDMRFWREGTWLHEAEPSCDRIEQQPGLPRTLCHLHTSLEAGLYLVTVYGGAPLDWAETPKDPEASPHLFLRWGIPSLGAAGRQWHTIGPVGIERHRVPGPASYFRVELAEKAPLTLQVTTPGSGNPYTPSGARASITDESRLPVAEVSRGSSGPKIVTVFGTPGQRYLLQHFEPLQSRYQLYEDGYYFATTLHGGDPADSIDPTAIVYSDNRDQVIPEWSRALKIKTSTRYRRKFNLLETAEMFLELPSDVELNVQTSGTKAKVRVQPVLIRRPRGYRVPPFQNTRLSKKLDAGFYHLTIEPIEPGIVELTVGASSFKGSARQMLGIEEPKDVSLPAALTWNELYLIKREQMTLLIARQPGVRVGMYLREKPLPVEHAIPMVLSPSKSWVQEITVGAAGTLRAVAEDGKLLPMTVDSRGGTRAAVRTGRHAVEVTNPRANVTHANLVLDVDAMRPSTPLPALDAGRLETLPKFPAMRADRPVHDVLERGEQKTWLLGVDEPALYRLETTGLLATEGDVRTRVRLGFAKASQNGIGRNFLVERYLRRGTYQVSVRTQGQSRGHLGVRLRRTELLEGGELRDRIPGRITVPAGRAVRYTFEVAEAGSYRIESYGQHQTFQCRIEDDGQWPLIEPVAPCDQTLELWPGTFGIIVQPTTTESRRVTRVTRRRSPAVREGHGPHPLAFDVGQTHVWYEPQPGQQRVPDQWTFELPAAAQVTLSVTAPMRARLVRTDGAKAEDVGEILANDPLESELPAGAYRVDVTAVRKNNKVPYTLTLTPRQLLAGMSRTVSTPGRIEISVGDGRLVELSSMGRADVRGRLYDAQGSLIAANDDRPDEWNFRITRRLAAGNYWLQVDRVGRSSGSTEIEMRTPMERSGEGLEPGKSRAVQVDDAVVSLPLSLPEEHRVLVVKTDADENVGAAIEVEQSPGQWRALGDAVGQHTRVAVRSASGTHRYRLRVWSLDQRGNPVRVSLFVPEVEDISEGSFESGEDVELDEGDPPFEIIQVEADPGLFTIDAAPPGALFCPSVGRACEPLTTATVAGEADGLWWAVPPGVLKGRRVSLRDGESVHAPLEPNRITRIDLSDDDDGVATAVVVRAAAGHPGLSLRAHQGAGMPDALGLAAAGAAAVAVDLSGEREVAQVWSGTWEALLGKVTVHRLAQRRDASWGWGLHREALAPATALYVEMPSLAATLSLSLPAGGIAVVPTAHGEQVFWADRRAQHVQVRVDGDRVVVLNATGEESVVAAEVFPYGELPLEPVAAGAPYEWMATRSRVTRVPVAADPSGHLETMGELEDAVYLRRDGRILAAKGAPVGPGGLLELHHRPGGALAWVQIPRRGTEPGPWAERADTVQYTVTAPTQIQLNEVSQRFVFDLRGPMMAHVRVPAPTVAQIHVEGARARTQMLQPGDSLNLWLPAGKGAVEVRGIGQTRMWGLAELGMSAPTPIGEGLGPEVMLSPGGAQVFSFEVVEAGKVGVGVRGEADWVTTELLNERGDLVGSGLLQMPELPVGTYVLALSLPTGVHPVRARPALAGVERPGDGPPEEVIRGYLKQAGYLEQSERGGH